MHFPGVGGTGREPFLLQTTWTNTSVVDWWVCCFHGCVGRHDVDSRHWSLQNQCGQWQLELGTVEHRHSTASTQMTRNTVRDHN